MLRRLRRLRQNAAPSLVILAVVAGCFPASVAEGSNRHSCQQFFVQPHHAHHRRVIVAPVAQRQVIVQNVHGGGYGSYSAPTYEIQYLVAQQVRLQALVAAEVNRQVAAQQAAAQQSQAATAPAQKPLANPPTPKPSPTVGVGKYALLKKTCGRCHGGDSPAKGINIDGTAELKPERILLVLNWLGGLEKPKGETMPGVIAKINAADKGPLMQQLLALQQGKGGAITE